MPYIYETHMHTAQASRCSDTPGRDYILKYIDQGYAGIIITDHFYRGNCAVDRGLPWKDFIRTFCSGYEDARNEGAKHNFPVFFGWEENVDGDEYLIYGPDAEWMISHPEMPAWTRREQYELVRAAGGCVVQAHPFRARAYLRMIHLAPYFADAVEGFNAGNERRWDTLAMRYGQLLGVPVTAGSDNHHASAMCREKLAGVVFDEPLTDIYDYVRAILQRRPFGLYLPEEVPAWTEDLTPDIEADCLDRNEEPSVDVMDLLRGRACPEGFPGTA